MINSTTLFLIVNTTHIYITNSSELKENRQTSQSPIIISADTTNASIVLDSSRKRSDCLCGEYRKKSQMIDEHTVWLANYPWLVGFVPRKENPEDIPAPFCYGSLIDRDTVLTAAHCVIRANASSTDAIFFGGRVTGERRRRGLAEIVIHEDYNDSNYLNNLALVKLKASVLRDGDGDLTPICLPNLKHKSKSKLQFQKTIIPMRQEHRTVFYAQLSYYFGVLEPRIIRTGKGNCSDLFIERLQSNNLCDHENAISYSNYCYAESGMPLMQYVGGDKKSEGKYTLLGVFSTGYGCRGYTGERPADVATAISDYTSWILENAFEGNDCTT